MRRVCKIPALRGMTFKLRGMTFKLRGMTFKLRGDDD